MPFSLFYHFELFLVYQCVAEICNIGTGYHLFYIFLRIVGFISLSMKLSYVNYEISKLNVFHILLFYFKSF